MSISVKICGLKDEANLRAAVNAGANYVGFVHYAKSPRHIEPATMIPLLATLPDDVAHVSVVVDPADALLAELHQINEIRRGYVQLHGHETPERMQEIKTKFKGMSLIKAIPVDSADDLSPEKINPFLMIADMLLFDAKPPKGAVLIGGNGVSFDWKILQGFQSTIPWLLSGGLKAENVQTAIRESGTMMVDVSSGVESAAGVKDAEKIKAFIEAARNE